MEWAGLLKAMHELRMSREEFRTATRFVQVSQVKAATVNAVEKGNARPTLPIIERWLKPFAVDLWEFLAQFNKKNPPARLPGFDPLYDAVDKLVTTRDHERISSVMTSITWMIRDGQDAAVQPAKSKAANSRDGTSVRVRR